MSAADTTHTREERRAALIDAQRQTTTTQTILDACKAKGVTPGQYAMARKVRMEYLPEDFPKIPEGTETPPSSYADLPVMLPYWMDTTVARLCCKWGFSRATFEAALKQLQIGFDGFHPTVLILLINPQPHHFRPNTDFRPAIEQWFRRAAVLKIDRLIGSGYGDLRDALRNYEIHEAMPKKLDSPYFILIRAARRARLPIELFLTLWRADPDSVPELPDLRNWVDLIHSPAMDEI